MAYIINRTDGNTAFSPDGKIIDGDSNGSVVFIANGEDSATLLSDFTLINGTGSEWGGHLNGGGVYISSASSATLENLIVENNSASWGGGIYFYPNAWNMIVDGPYLSNIIIRNKKKGVFG